MGFSSTWCPMMVVPLGKNQFSKISNKARVA